MRLRSPRPECDWLAEFIRKDLRRHPTLTFISEQKEAEGEGIGMKLSVGRGWEEGGGGGGGATESTFTSYTPIKPFFFNDIVTYMLKTALLSFLLH